MFYVYILYSKTIDKHYIGECTDITLRLQQHNTCLYQGSFTTRANDWKIIFQLECRDRTQARAIEKHIKNMKSKKYIDSITNYPDISKKLLEKYQ